MRLSTALVLTTLTLVWACKDDSESDRGDGGFSSGGGEDAGGGSGGGGTGDGGNQFGGVPGDKRLGELTADETVDICEDLRSTVDTEQTRRGTCVLAAGFAVAAAPPDTAVEACETQLDACLQVAPEPCNAMMFTERCEATVAQLVGCLRIASEQLTELSTRSCEDIVMEAQSDAGVSSQLEDELDTCSAMLNACQASAENECCTENDDCNYGGDGFCDCPDQAWDEADCN